MIFSESIREVRIVNKFKQKNEVALGIVHLIFNAIDVRSRLTVSIVNQKNEITCMSPATWSKQISQRV